VAIGTQQKIFLSLYLQFVLSIKLDAQKILVIKAADLVVA